MTALAACIFALAALGSALAIIGTLHRYGTQALALRARLARCPETLEIQWALVERVTVPPLSPMRRDRITQRRFQVAMRPGLEWPTGEIAA